MRRLCPGRLTRCRITWRPTIPPSGVVRPNRPARSRMPDGPPGSPGRAHQHPDRPEHDDHRPARRLDHRRGAADQRHEQRDHPRTEDHRCLRLLPGLGPDRRGRGHWNSEYDTHLVYGAHPGLGQPQRSQRRIQCGRRSAVLLRPALPAPRRAAGHHHGARTW